MATGPQPESLFNFMDLVSTGFMIFVLVAIFLKLRKQAKKVRATKTGLSSVFVWLGVFFIGVSVWLFTTSGPTVSLLLSNTLDVYPQPITLATVVCVIGITLFAVAAFIAILLRERTPKEPKAPKTRREGGIAARKSAGSKPAEQFQGTEVFAGHDNN